MSHSVLSVFLVISFIYEPLFLYPLNLHSSSPFFFFFSFGLHLSLCLPSVPPCLSFMFFQLFLTHLFLILYQFPFPSSFLYLPVRLCLSSPPPLPLPFLGCESTSQGHQDAVNTLLTLKLSPSIIFVHHRVETNTSQLPPPPPPPPPPSLSPSSVSPHISLTISCHMIPTLLCFSHLIRLAFKEGSSVQFYHFLKTACLPLHTPFL